MKRPTIIDARYKGLDDSTKLREYERDLVLYEQLQQSEKNSNTQKELVSLLKDKLEQEKEEKRLDADIQNKQFLEDRLIRNLPHEEQMEYYNNSIEDTQKEREIKAKITDAVLEIYKILDKILSNRLLDFKINSSEIDRLKSKMKSLKSVTLSFELFLMIIGGVFILALNNTIHDITYFKIGILLFILIYPVVNLFRYTRIKHKHNRLCTKYKSFKNYTEFIDYTEFERLYRKDGLSQSVIYNKYRDYCTKYMKDLKNDYINNIEYYKNIFISKKDFNDAVEDICRIGIRDLSEIINRG